MPATPRIAMTPAARHLLDCRSVPTAPTYYVPRDRLSPRLLLTFPVLGGGAAVALGILYGLASCLVTQVFEEPPMFVIATPLFGAVLAAVGRWVADRGQVRKRQWRLAQALAISAIGLYVSWQAYLVLGDLRIFDFTPTWTMSPARLVRGMAELAGSNGASSWLWWAVEAATVLGMVVYLMRAVDIEVPFCEQCNAWTTVVSRFEIADRDTSDAAARLLAGQAAALAELTPRPAGESDYAIIRVYRCPCATSRYVSLDRAHRSLGESAGLRTGAVAIGGRPTLHLSMGSSETTDLTPVVTNLIIDEAAERALVIARDELVKRRHATA